MLSTVWVQWNFICNLKPQIHMQQSLYWMNTYKSWKCVQHLFFYAVFILSPLLQTSTGFILGNIMFGIYIYPEVKCYIFLWIINPLLGCLNQVVVSSALKDCSDVLHNQNRKTDKCSSVNEMRPLVRLILYIIDVVGIGKE